MNAGDTNNTLSDRRLILDYGPTTYFGAGAITELASIVDARFGKRAFLVTDRGVVASGIVEEIRRELASSGCELSVWDGIHPNPSTETVDRGASALREVGQAVVVAVGGGSVLDAAKSIALVAANTGPARDFDYRNEPAHPGFPVITIPTTAGTGSETNSFGVIDDEQARRKFYIGHPSVLPRAVILDPNLTRGLPPEPTAATGMDVLTHALESLSSPSNNPYAESLNLQVVRMVGEFLPAAVSDGQNLEARSQMLLAAHMAGLAFATTGLGLGHAAVHALSARLGVAHGVGLAVLLPHVLSFNMPLRSNVYARAAWALGVSDSSKDDRSNAEAAVECIRDLALKVGMPASLRSLGCDETAIPAIAEAALEDSVIANSPRIPAQEEMEELLRGAL